MMQQDGKSNDLMDVAMGMVNADNNGNVFDGHGGLFKGFLKQYSFLIWIIVTKCNVCRFK